MAAKPETGRDACWTAAGVRIDDTAEVNGTGPCTALPALAVVRILSFARRSGLPERLVRQPAHKFARG